MESGITQCLGTEISIAAEGSASDPHSLISALPPLTLRRDLQCVQKHLINEPRHQGGKSCKHNTARAPQISRACCSRVYLALLWLKISTSSVFVNKIVVIVRHAVHLAAYPDARHQRQLRGVYQRAHELQPQSAQRINTGSGSLYCRLPVYHPSRKPQQGAQLGTPRLRASGHRPEAHSGNGLGGWTKIRICVTIFLTLLGSF